MTSDPDARPSWLFDVDATLIDAVTGDHLRPLARRLLELLRERDVRVLLWSSGGAPYARRRARQHGVDHLVDDTYAKIRDARDGCWTLPAPLLDHPPQVLVDDVPGEVPAVGEVIGVRPFLGANPHDDGLAFLVHRLEQQFGRGGDGTRI